MRHNWCIGTSAVYMCLGWNVEEGVGEILQSCSRPAFFCSIFVTKHFTVLWHVFPCSVVSCRGKDGGLMVSAMDSWV